MGKVARAAGVLWRYLQIKSRYREVHATVRSLYPDELEYHIRRGCPAFDGVVVNADEIRPITSDAWDPDLLDAIIYERGAVPELAAAEQVMKPMTSASMMTDCMMTISTAPMVRITPISRVRSNTLILIVPVRPMLPTNAVRTARSPSASSGYLGH